MALLVTSCTMGKQPKQLLDKGPDYLRTKTNRQLFAHHRKSAVELLAASRPQFVKSTQALNKSSSFDNSIQGSIFGKSGTWSKSEYNLCQQDRVDALEEKREIDQLDSGIVRVNIESTCRSETHCCINGSQGRKINKSHRNYVDPDSSCFKQLQSLVPTRYGNKLKEVNRTDIKAETVQDTDQDTMSEEEKMMVDNVMTLSTDMSSTQDVDMEYKSGFVQRSHSDLSCQHSRNSPVLDRNSARYSRASADLEKFFNGMGIERNILDPMLRRQDNTTQKEGDIFESISSLDSPDTRSVCSGVSKLSEKTYSSTDCLERTLQSTSVVERNARIIKWLCNIKKAKQPLTSD